MRVSDERVKKASNYFNNSLDFKAYLESKRLMEGAQPTTDGVLMCCPFHHDSTPSMRIDFNRNIYKCFSCGCGGNIIGFMRDYSKNVLGDDRNYFQLLDSLLRENRRAQLELGFSSVFEEGVDLDNFKPSGFKKFKVKEIEPKTFLQLANYIKTKGTFEDRLDAIKLMQDGFNVEYIFKFLYKKSSHEIGDSSVFEYTAVTLENLLKEE